MSEEINIDEDASFVVEKIANVVKASSGKLSIKLEDKTAIELNFGGDTVTVDIVEPKILGMADQLESHVGLLEKLRTARRVGEILNNEGLSISILRKGKKALSIGRNATPSISSLITRSDDIQIDSITQVAKLGSDIKKGNQDYSS
ncbi:MAG TPA: hypothetical protein VFM20_00715 [Nitrososphaeraceae archaeon]|nr:hypothetical protein [Nitrososphaeraceae archaeon]